MKSPLKPLPSVTQRVRRLKGQDERQAALDAAHPLHWKAIKGCKLLSAPQLSKLVDYGGQLNLQFSQDIFSGEKACNPYKDVI